MKLPLPPVAYSKAHEIECNRTIEQADRFNHKRGQDVDIADTRLILTAPNGSKWSVVVSNTGTLSTTAI